jgi:hypothetical protein
MAGEDSTPEAMKDGSQRKHAETGLFHGSGGAG